MSFLGVDQQTRSAVSPNPSLSILRVHLTINESTAPSRFCGFLPPIEIIPKEGIEKALGNREQLF